MPRSEQYASGDEPSLSVVVGSTAQGPVLEQCLSALEPQRDGAEIFVCEDVASPESLQERFPWARFIERRGALTPELWTSGIHLCRAPVVALTIAPMAPAPDWIDSIVAQHAGRDVVAGAIEPGRGLRLRDWAEYFCRYSPDMLPFADHQSRDLPGDNASYKRALLEQVAQVYEDGFWEPDVHLALDERGVELWHSPDLVVRQGRSAGARAFLRQRLVHGRAHGRQRGARFGRLRNALGVVGALAVPLLLSARILRQVGSRRRLRAPALAALPLILLYNAAWAAGEARGHLDALVRRP